MPVVISREAVWPERAIPGPKPPPCPQQWWSRCCSQALWNEDVLSPNHVVIAVVFYS